MIRTGLIYLLVDVMLCRLMDRVSSLVSDSFWEFGHMYQITSRYERMSYKLIETSIGKVITVDSDHIGVELVTQVSKCVYNDRDSYFVNRESGELNRSRKSRELAIITQINIGGNRIANPTRVSVYAEFDDSDMSITYTAMILSGRYCRRIELASIVSTVKL